MSHRTLTELQNELTQARAQVMVAGHYYHYKHPEVAYVVNGLSILEATDEVAVRYSVVDDPTVEFVRPLSSWLETIKWRDATVLRFTPIDQ